MNLRDAQRVPWEHLKTGGIYRILNFGRIEADQTECVIYECIITGNVWVRPKAEFFDGRFKQWPTKDES